MPDTSYTVGSFHWELESILTIFQWKNGIIGLGRELNLDQESKFNSFRIMETHVRILENND